MHYMFILPMLGIVWMHTQVSATSASNSTGTTHISKNEMFNCANLPNIKVFKTQLCLKHQCAQPSFCVFCLKAKPRKVTGLKSKC